MKNLRMQWSYVLTEQLQKNFISVDQEKLEEQHSCKGYFTD